MKRIFTLLSVFLLIMSIGLLFAQDLNYKTGFQFPTEAQDSVVSGLRSVRGTDFHANPLGDNVAAFASTNYIDNGFIHVFKNIGDDAMELVWTSPAFDSLGGSSRPRFVKWADLDNDGIIELIAPFNQNGLAIFEWDGVAGSWNFGDAPAKIIADPLYPTADSLTVYHSVEYLEVEDVDNDGMNELLLANNSDGNEFDRYYIFSINGTYSTGNPGFSTIKREGMWYKSAGDYAAYGGGTPYAMITADLNGDGVKNVLFHNWNYGHISPLRSTAADTYLLADTTGGNHYVYGNYPDDCVSLGGGTAFDIDGDGREEVFIPLYSANGLVEMVHFPEGHDLSKIDSTNIFMIDMFPMDDDRHDFYGRPGYGDYDQNGKPNIYVAHRHKNYVMSAEFQGGDKTDPANWVASTIYTGEELDATIFSAVTYSDSAGVLDTVKVLQADSEGTIAMKIFGMYTDFDKDGYEDIIMPSQTWKDSIDVTHTTWIRDTAYTVYDTSYAGTDSMTVDTVDVEESIWEDMVSKEVEPNRISIRMLEGTKISGIEAKDLTVIMPNDYKLEQNYPNPFNPTTNIEFYLPIKKQISLTIYNALGQKVRTLVNNEVLNKGLYAKEWDGKNSFGNPVASGMYIYELKYGNFTKQKRMMLLK